MESWLGIKRLKHDITLFSRTYVVFLTAPKPPRKTRAELMKDIDADYYGYRDEDDGRLLPLEKEAEENGK